MSDQGGPVNISEWSDSREAGAVAYRLVDGGADAGIWLEMRDQNLLGAWSEWEEVDLDGPGWDLLVHLPALRARLRAEERDSIRREMLVALNAHFRRSIAVETAAVGSTSRHGERRHRAALALVRADIDRICPVGPEEG